ncbi:MAG: amidohydrolase [Synergistaceae bacterium]|jgi:aminobenzoyl-glutamate utilization protein B|nr:amidohydrolase [Synergistaceae bacterium]
MTDKNGKKTLSGLIDAKAGLFAGVSDAIWDCAETRFDLEKSADMLISVLEKEGFAIERGVADMKDAFVATYKNGEGGPVVGFLAEYDALPGLSQESGVFERKPIREGGSGHGCGHNALGAGSLAAAVGLKDFLAASAGKTPATVKFFGCPAEESGSGKAFMARSGVFGGTDAFFTWHPMGENRVWGCSSLANYQVYFHFKGLSAHAAAAPEKGRSALDALELMSVGVNYLREHVVQEARIHYAYTNAGGMAPNVVQSDASALYFIRAPKSAQVRPIFERVVDIAKGAALMSGTAMEIEWDSACAEYIVNDALGRAMHENMRELGDTKYTDEEKACARRYVATLPEGSNKGVADLIKKSFPELEPGEVEAMASEPLQEKLFPYVMTDDALPGSTDVSDASWVAPTAQLLVGCYPTGAPSHSWQWVAFGKSPAIHKGLIYAGKVMAMTALDVIDDPELAAKAKREHLKRLNGEKYVCAIPENVKPH